MRFALILVLLLLSGVVVTAQTTKPAEIPTDAKHRKIHPATQPGQVLEMSLKELGNFDFDQDNGSPIPDDVKALSGVTIKLHGVMVPMDQAEHITKFALAPLDLFTTNKSPPLQQTIIVTCPPGETVEYCPDEIVIQGKLKVGIVKDDGFIYQVFGVDDARVKPASK